MKFSWKCCGKCTLWMKLPWKWKPSCEKRNSIQWNLKFKPKLTNSTIHNMKLWFNIHPITLVFYFPSYFFSCSNFPSTKIQSSCISRYIRISELNFNHFLYIIGTACWIFFFNFNRFFKSATELYKCKISLIKFSWI